MANGDQGASCGRWYLGTTCRHCGTPMFFAPSRGPDHEIPADAHVHARCPSCGHEADYGGRELRQFQVNAVR
jgi:hypothetical protein